MVKGAFGKRKGVVERVTQPGQGCHISARLSLHGRLLHHVLVLRQGKTRGLHYLRVNVDHRDLELGLVRALLNC